MFLPKRQSLRAFISAFAVALFSSSSWAIAPYLESWNELYPSSSSGEIRCQLCHLQRDGGEPWNAYGNDIRQIFNLVLDPETRTIEQAIRAVESLNSDQDSPATTNLVEINTNQQPAWKEGQTNQAFNRLYFSVGVFFEPITLNPIQEKIDVIETSLEVREISDGLVSPTVGVVAPISTLNNQLFIADQVGIIWRVNINTGATSEYINLQDWLVPLGVFESCGYDERGLLGLAFHPQFAENGLLYVHTSQVVAGSADFTTLSESETANHQGVVTEIKLSNPASASGLAQITNQRDILRVDQPQFNHNGGALAFDSQGYLYISLGDGGGADDQGTGHGASGNGSDPSNPFGAILRIDPMGNSSDNGQYSIPPTNPFINTSVILNEIYAYGFRNPWKMYFDSQGQLFVADVGQNDIEEINLVEAGQHYGWNIREGRFFFYDNGEASGTIGVEAPSSLPNVNLINPLFSYDHDEGISVTGGIAYKGPSNEFLTGKHIFSDFNNRLFLGDPSTSEVKALESRPSLFVNSLAEDANGGVYILGASQISTCTTVSAGKLIRLEAANQDEESLCFPIKGQQGEFSIVCL